MAHTHFRLLTIRCVATAFLVCNTIVLLAQDSAVETQQAPAASLDGEQSVRPDINSHYLDPNLQVENWIGKFEIESREVFSAREEVLAALDIQKGMVVADVGAGTGIYTVLMSQHLALNGWVYAVDIAPRFVEHIASLAKKHHLKNVTPMLCAENSVRLPPQSVDLVFTCDVYHHFEYPSATLASIHSALRPGGRFVVIDFEKIPGVSREWTIGHVRADKETVRKEVEAAGFELVEEKDIKGLTENYLLVFRSRSAQ